MRSPINAVRNGLFIALLMCLPLPGGTIEVFSKDGKDCFCWPAKVVPAVYKGVQISQEKVTI